MADVPAFWALPALFTVDMGDAEPLHVVINTSAELTALYGKLFGPSTGVDQTMIDTSEVTFYGDKLATIRTDLRHLAKGEIHDKQKAIYGCRKIDGVWMFVSHLSVDVD